MRTSLWRAVLAAAGLAACQFAWVFGLDVLDVQQFGWMIHGDSAQHYLGWAFFRATDWQWPLGLVPNFAHPFKTTVAFTDSIPLVVLPLKLLSAWLPGVFNFFGWWMAVCVVGNSMAAAWVLQRLGLSLGAVVLGAGLFALTPCMMLRAYGHESLMAQGLLLLALGLALPLRVATPFRGRAWMVLLLACVLVHPYFWVMVCALFAAALVQASGHGRALHWWQALVWFAAGVCLTAVALFCLGYFESQGKTVWAIGYPNYSANLLTWLDPMDWQWFLRQYQRDPAGAAQWSRWLPSLGQADRDQYEGFAYLGAGALLLVFLAAAVVLLRRRPSASAGQLAAAQSAAMPVWGWPVWCVLVLMALYALSTKVTLGSWVLLDLPRSEAVHQALSVFRACGRFIWPLTYALMLWSLAQLCRWGWRAQWAWALLALGLQLADLSGKMQEFHRMYSPAKPYVTPLSDPAWDGALSSASHLVVLEDTTLSDDWIAFSVLAARHGVVNSTGLLSRVNEQQLRDWVSEQRQRVWAGQPQSATVYVSRQPFPAVLGWTPLSLNGWWVLVPRPAGAATRPQSASNKDDAV